MLPERPTPPSQPAVPSFEDHGPEESLEERDRREQRELNEEHQHFFALHASWLKDLPRGFIDQYVAEEEAHPDTLPPRIIPAADQTIKLPKGIIVQVPCYPRDPHRFPHPTWLIQALTKKIIKGTPISTKDKTWKDIRLPDGMIIQAHLKIVDSSGKELDIG